MLAYVWIGLGLVTGMVAHYKGRNLWLWTIFGLLAPIIGLAAAVLRPPNKKTVEKRILSRGEEKRCPHCAELVKREARICKHCQQPLSVAERASFRQASFDALDSDYQLPVVTPVLRRNSRS